MCSVPGDGAGASGALASHPTQPRPRSARWPAGARLAAVLGLFGYLLAVIIVRSTTVGPIFANRFPGSGSGRLILLSGICVPRKKPTPDDLDGG